MLFHAVQNVGRSDVPSITVNHGHRQARERGAVKVHDPVSDRPITIRLADSAGERNAARLLLNRMYSWRGYGDQHTIASTPSHTTFTASSDEDELIGTITLAIDSPAGLAVDTLFRDVVDQFRSKPGAQVCELTKFAFDMAKHSKPTLASLFHLIFIYGRREYGCSDLFIEVNPRHVRFYEMMLGFTCLGELKMNESVAAPSQLMWLSVAGISDRINRFAGTGDQRLTRSLYPYFFSPQEELGLYGRMVGSRGPFASPELENCSSSSHRVEPSHGARALVAGALNGTAETAPLALGG